MHKERTARRVKKLKQKIADCEAMLLIPERAKRCIGIKYHWYKSDYSLKLVILSADIDLRRIMQREEQIVIATKRKESSTDKRRKHVVQLARDIKETEQMIEAKISSIRLLQVSTVFGGDAADNSRQIEQHFADIKRLRISLSLLKRSFRIKNAERGINRNRTVKQLASVITKQPVITDSAPIDFSTMFSSE